MASFPNTLFSKITFCIALASILTGASCVKDTGRRGEAQDPCDPKVVPMWMQAKERACSLMGGFCDTVPVVIPVAHPAEINLTKFKTVAFTEIGGNYGEAFSTSLQQKIVEDGGLKVIDRNELQRLLKEQGLSQNDLFDSKNKVKLGKLLPAAVFVSGNVIKSYKETTSEGMGNCPDPKNPLKLKKRIPCPTFTLTGFATIEGNVKFVNVETGADIQVKHLKASEDKKKTGTGKQPEPINENALHETNLEKITVETARAILPWKEDRKVVFYRDKELPLLWEGIVEAKAGEIDEAKKLFTEAITVAEGDPEISQDALTYAHWNKALTHTYTGEFKAAKREYKKVERLAPGEYETAWMRKVVKCLKADEKKRRAAREQG